ncbi:MAG: YfiR family protein [Chitinophagaceae bacterium]|nr:MAG: YfiR family protein [Chitinophagaceae bacterium]
MYRQPSALLPPPVEDAAPRAGRYLLLPGFLSRPPRAATRVPLLRGRLLRPLLLLLLFAGAALQPAAQEPARTAMAVSLLQCCRYVEWPATAFTGPGAPLVIGIAGIDPFGAVLDSVVRGHFVRGRRVQVRRFGAGEPLDCQLLFVADSTALPGALPPGRPVLTVSTGTGFTDPGGMVCLVPEGKKLRLLVRPAIARAAGLHISSKLLRLAKIVYP